jgi:hypothetical protein
VPNVNYLDLIGNAEPYGGIKFPGAGREIVADRFLEYSEAFQIQFSRPLNAARLS